MSGHVVALRGLALCVDVVRCVALLYMLLCCAMLRDVTLPCFTCYFAALCYIALRCCCRVVLCCVRALLLSCRAVLRALRCCCRAVLCYVALPLYFVVGRCTAFCDVVWAMHCVA